MPSFVIKLTQVTPLEVIEMTKRYCVVDIETTGQTAGVDRIIQIGAVLIEDGEIIERFATYVNPLTKIPTFIKQLTGITDEVVKHAPTFDLVAKELLLMLEGASFVAHNVRFDLSFLQKELEDAGYHPFTGYVIDTVELARLLLPKEDGYKLNQLAEKLDITHERPHQADSDAEVTAHLLLVLLHKLKKLPAITLQQLKPVMKRLQSDIDQLLLPIIHEKQRKLQDDDTQFDIYRGLAIRKKKKWKRQPLDEPMPFAKYKEALVNQDGQLANVFTDYEVRTGQQEMMDEVNDALSESKHLLIEAGTGTGKSIAYLLPSVFWAKNEQKPVVISTQTIPLQQQLLDRDIPLLKNVTPFPFHVALLKGRNHYLCLRKFEQRVMGSYDEDNYDTLLSMGQILIWLTETTTGDVEELNLPSGGRAFWHEVKSDAATCLGNRCPWFSRCFYQTARKNAQQAEIIITNHALLFTDLVHKKSLLPSYSQVIIDEAHHLEEVACDHLGEQTDYVTFAYLWNRFGTLETKGIVKRFHMVAEQYELDHGASLHQFVQVGQQVKEEIDELFRMLRAFVEKQAVGKTEIGRISYRYMAHEESGPLWSNITEVALRMLMYSKNMEQLGMKLAKPLELIKDGLTLEERGVLTDFKSWLQSWQEETTKIERLLLEYDPNLVYWMETDERGAKNGSFLYSKPIDIGELLADHFFMHKKSVVLTSATLTVKRSFSYLIERLGLQDFGPSTTIVPSPFQYETQAKLLIPTDVPAINSPQFKDDIIDKIVDVAFVTKGRMLILFTSYDMLKQVYAKVKDRLSDEDFHLIGQGVNSGSRAKLMKAFKQHDKAILFGTSSFWEGIDIPGEDLSCLIIVRLPFSPPDDPVLEARSERLKETGKNPFMELSLPQAILRFKQGFGRLIRTSHDKGVVIVFDKRIITTKYGASFLASLPSVPVYEDEMKSLLNVCKNWL